MALPSQQWRFLFQLTPLPEAEPPLDWYVPDEPNDGGLPTTRTIWFA